MPAVRRQWWSAVSRVGMNVSGSHVTGRYRIPLQGRPKFLRSTGIDVLSADVESFRAALIRESRTLKRALTDPRIVSGFGNAYSDEILHAARLSPLTLTGKLKPEEWDRLLTAARGTLELWLRRLRAEAREPLPGESHRVSRRHGRSRALRKTMSSVRCKNSPHPLCGQRNKLLRELPDRGPSARRPRPFPAAGRRLAAHAG